MRGLNSTIGFFLGSQKKEIFSKTWKVKRNGTKVNDGVNGEDRDRLDFVVTDYSCDLEVYTKDLVVVESFVVDEQDNEDAQALPLDKALYVRFKPRGSSVWVATASEGCLDDWEIGSSGRTDSIMTTVPMRFRYFKKTPI